MKKLLIDVNSIVPYYVCGKVTGIGRTTLELIQALSKVPDIPFEISLYSQNMKGIGGKNTGLPFKNKHLYLPHRETYDRLLSKSPVKKWFTGYDLLHIPHNFEYVHRPEKCVITLHDALFMKMQEEAFHHDQMKSLVPSLMRQCKHIITCSESSKKDIVETMQVAPEKISVIYWGVKHETFYPTKDEGGIKQQLYVKYGIERPYFFSVSCNAERKQTDVLVRSYLKCCNQYTEHDLTLVWSNPPQILLEEITAKGLTDKIHFLKNISDEDLALLYRGATALFFPSAYEGFGLPIIEAMACGTLVITCKNSSLEEVGGKAAIYLTEPIEDSIIDLMEKLKNGNLQPKINREQSIAQAGKFSWENTAKQYIQLYTQMLRDQ